MQATSAYSGLSIDQDYSCRRIYLFMCNDAQDRLLVRQREAHPIGRRAKFRWDAQIIDKSGIGQT